TGCSRGTRWHGYPNRSRLGARRYRRRALSDAAGVLMPHAMAAVRDNALFGSPAGPDGVIPVGSAAWLSWLEAPATRGFRFEQGAAGFTARRERGWGGWYWYAYRKDAGRLYKAYLGRAAELTPDRRR